MERTSLEPPVLHQLLRCCFRITFSRCQFITWNKVNLTLLLRRKRGAAAVRWEGTFPLIWDSVERLARLDKIDTYKRQMDFWELQLIQITEKGHGENHRPIHLEGHNDPSSTFNPTKQGGASSYHLEGLITSNNEGIKHKDSLMF